MSFNKAKLNIIRKQSRASSFKNYRDGDLDENLSRSTENEGNSSDREGDKRQRTQSLNDNDSYRRLQASYKALSNDYKQLQTQNIELEHRIRQLEMGGAPLGGGDLTETNEEHLSMQLEIEVLSRLKKEVSDLTTQLLLSDLDGEILTGKVSKYMQDLQRRNEFLENKIDDLETQRLQVATTNQRQDSDLNQMSMQLMKLSKEKKSAEKKVMSLTADNTHLNELVRDLRNEIERLNLFGSDLPHLPNIPDVNNKQPSAPHGRANSFQIERKNSSLRKLAVHGRAKTVDDGRRKRSDATPTATSPKVVQGRPMGAASPSTFQDVEFGSVKDFLMNDPEWTEEGLWGVKIETQVNARSEIRVVKHWKFTTSDGSAHRVQLMHVQDRFRSDSMREIIIDNMPQYRKKSNAGNFHFKINNDDVVLTIQTLANGWTYELILNGNLWRTAREMVEAIE